MRSQIRTIGFVAGKFVRSPEDIENSDLWSFRGELSDLIFESRRYRAIATVLMRLAPDEYLRVQRVATAFDWFIPDEREHGKVQPFRATKSVAGLAEVRGRIKTVERWEAAVLYLSPMLERRSLGFVAATVAHELAHLALGHRIRHLQVDEYKRQEREAWALVKQWGFDREVRIYEAWQTRMKAREARRFAQGMAKMARS